MGSKLGWILGGVLVSILVAFLVLRLGFPRTWRALFVSPSSPNATLQEGLLELHTISVPVSRVAGLTPDASGNAADDYAEAAKIAVADDKILTAAKLALDEAEREPASITPQALDALKRIAQHVADGARKKQMKYVFQYTPKALKVSMQIQGLRGLEEVIASMQILARYYLSHKKYDQAESVLRDLLVMGRHMIDERSHVHIVELGLGAQRAAWDRLFPLYATDRPDADKAAALRAYEAASIEFEEFWYEKRKIVWTPGHNRATGRSPGPDPGDIFNIIENDKDKAWRVQAILVLGIIKYAAERPVDIEHSRKLLDRLVGDPDPLIAAAAKAAKDLTIEGFRTIDMGA